MKPAGQADEDGEGKGWGDGPWVAQGTGIAGFVAWERMYNRRKEMSWQSLVTSSAGEETRELARAKRIGSAGRTVGMEKCGAGKASHGQMCGCQLVCPWRLGSARLTLVIPGSIISHAPKSE